MDGGSSRRKRRDYVKSNDTRMQWNQKLHQAFLLAIERIGGLAKATPKLIVHVMDMEGVTISHVKSHLQMYRCSLKMDRNKRERRKRSHKNNGGNSDQQQDDDSLHSASNPTTNESQPRRTRAPRRLPMEPPHPICNALECNKGIKSGGISTQQRESSIETAPQLKHLLVEEGSNTSKENRTDDQHLTPTSILTSEAMEERQEPNDCSLSISLSLPDQRNILASRSSSTSIASSLKNSNEHDKSDGRVNLELSISM